MAIITSQPYRGDKITEQDTATEAMSIFMSDITESINRDLPRNNFTASVDPTATDNIDLGYTRGSEWINNTTNKVYRLTSFSGTNAVWSLLN